MQCLLLDTSQWIRYNLYPTAPLPPIRRNMAFTNNHNTRWKRTCAMKGEKILQVSRKGRVNFGWGPGFNATWENTWRIDWGIICNHSYSQFPAMGENYTSLPFWIQKCLCGLLCHKWKWKCVYCLPLLFPWHGRDTYSWCSNGGCSNRGCPQRPLLFPSGYSLKATAKVISPRREFFKAKDGIFSSSFSLPTLAAHVCKPHWLIFSSCRDWACPVQALHRHQTQSAAKGGSCWLTMKGLVVPVEKQIFALINHWDLETVDHCSIVDSILDDSVGF